MRKYHTGGLSGYRDEGYQARLYDPDQNTYKTYLLGLPPLPAGTFTETFDVILLYKRPSSKFYQSMETYSLTGYLVQIIIGSLMLIFVYMILFALAREYIRMKEMPDKLSHSQVRIQFSKIVGLSLGKVLIIVFFVIGLVIVVSSLSVKKMVKHYNEFYATKQEILRSELLRKISPRDTISGVVFRRFREMEEYNTLSDIDNKGSAHNNEGTAYRTVLCYTIEFENILPIPVYINLKLPDPGEGLNDLDRPFSDKAATIPEYMKSFTFVVNPDYSISLYKDKNTLSE
ncbi:MAG: hypothetical protein JXB49_04580 [Bacteroidales bacterium]|nr:hypothetical protein [Bacteroidales bacterium]